MPGGACQPVVTAGRYAVSSRHLSPPKSQSLRAHIVTAVRWLITFGSIALILHWIPIREVATALRQASPMLLAAAALIATTNVAMRGVRWSTLMGLRSPRSVASVSAIASVGLAANAIYPGKVGEVLRIGLLRTVLNIRLGRGAMAALVERLLDMSVLVVLAWICLRGLDLAAGLGHSLQRIVEVLMVGVVGLLLVVMVSAMDGVGAKARSSLRRRLVRWPRIRRFASHVMLDVRTVARQFLLTRAGGYGLVMTLTLWLLMATSVYMCGLGFSGLSCTFGAAVVIMAMTTLASAIPSGPGAWGVFEAAGIMVGSQVVSAADQGVLAAFIVASHLVQYLVVVLAGLVAWLALGKPRREVAQAARGSGDTP